ncbi:hypothetical protein [Ramlibacter sp. AN1133]|uniref:hypothetical protein n=1 Tax=Ramlibacter sp. AN1133 TaxID=3133429 RepID=UPI0030BAE887
MHKLVRLAPILLAVTGAFAQEPEFPKDLHGRWTAATQAGRTTPQPFDLEGLQRKDDGTFSGRLSWTTPDPRCIVRFKPITGRVTAKGGLQFESATPCGEAITAELMRGPGGWVGQATNKATPQAVMDLTAK